MRKLKRRMNRRLGIGSSKGYENANREVLAWNPSTPDEPTAHGLHQWFIRWYVCAISLQWSSHVEGTG
jgi:hypothetical protein